MENNQQNKSEGNNSTANADSAINNQQPGQQLPSKNEDLQNVNLGEVTAEEYHSDSSKPNAENETLGTPKKSWQFTIIASSLIANCQRNF